MDDSIKLLKECDAGIKMAISSIDEIMDYVESNDLKEILITTRKHHAEDGNKINTYLHEFNASDKDPNPMAKGMSWFKINMQMKTGGDDHNVASLMTDGCNMGIKSLNKYLNQYKAADKKIVTIAERIISSEEDMIEAMKKYL